MKPIPSLLMVTWNRREYFEKTIQNLLSDPSEYRLYFWDNNSVDGVRDLIHELKDDRIAARQFSNENVKQYAPWHWFLENCQTDIAGKLDDDILGERGWAQRFSTIITEESQISALGAWVYLPSEWDLRVAKPKIVRVGQYEIFRSVWLAAGVFVGRLSVLRKYLISDPKAWGVPIDWAGMTKAGFISGLPIPVSFAEHLDDPRSPHCRMNRPGGWDEYAAYTARMRKFSGPQEYGDWIAADAKRYLEMQVSAQLQLYSPTRAEQFKKKAIRVVRKLTGR